jgi:uncharacterized membrane protein
MIEREILRLIHIVGGVIWVGSVFFFVVFISPVIAASGAEGGRMMMRIAGSKYPPVISAIAGITILAGARLYMINMAGGEGWASTPEAMTYGLGAVAAVLSLVLGLTMQKPAGARMAALAKEVEAGGGVPTPAQAAAIGETRTKLMSTGKLILGLLMIATICMAAARYISAVIS